MVLLTLYQALAQLGIYLQKRVQLVQLVPPDLKVFLELQRHKEKLDQQVLLVLLDQQVLQVQRDQLVHLDHKVFFM
jgi:hypothetical protein